MPTTKEFEIQRRKDGGTWSTVATVTDTEYTYDSTDENYTWYDTSDFEYNALYEYRLMETTDDSDWSNTKGYTWDVDTTPPSITVTPESRSYDNTTVDVTVESSDSESGLSTLEYAWSTSTTTPSSWTAINSGDVVSQSSTGEWYLHVQATDTSGNTNTEYYGTYNIDKVEPSISVSPSSQDNNGGDISATIDVTEDESSIDNIEYAWTESTSTPSSWTTTTNGSSVTQSTVGTWYLHVRATDTAGNTNTTYFGTYKKYNYMISSTSVSQSGNDLILDWVYEEYVLQLLVDDFEDGDMSEYTYVDGSSGGMTTDLVYEGTYAYQISAGDTNTNIGISFEGDGLDSYPSQEDTFRFYFLSPSDLDRSGSADIQAGIVFGAEDTSNYYILKLDEVNDEFAIDLVDSGSQSVLTSTAYTDYWNSEWRYVTVSWATDGTINAKLFNPSDDTELASISIQDTTLSGNGFGNYAYCSTSKDGGEIIVDLIEIIGSA